MIPPWWTRAACIGVPIEEIYPTENCEVTMRLFAATFCKTCPVKGKCRDDAVAHRDPYGVWGGLLPHEGKRVHHAE